MVQDKDKTTVSKEDWSGSLHWGEGVYRVEGGLVGLSSLRFRIRIRFYRVEGGLVGLQLLAQPHVRDLAPPLRQNPTASINKPLK